jgi:hypothetical protein
LVPTTWSKSAPVRSATGRNGHAGVGEHHVEPPVPLVDGRHQGVEVGEPRDVTADGQHPSSAAASSSRCRSRPVITTRAPSATSRRAVASPMPLVPPVTSAILPSSREVMARACRPSGEANSACRTWVRHHQAQARGL